MQKSIKCKKVKAKQFDSKKLKIFWFVLFIAALLSIFAAFIAPEDTRSLKVNNMPIFYSIVGFLSCVVMVIFSRIIGFLLRRDENYFENKLDNQE